jgi:cellulose synthase (UDP-forming)
MTTTEAATPRTLPITVPPRLEALWPAPLDAAKTRRIRVIALAAIVFGVGYVIWRLAVTLSPLSLALGIPLLLLEAWSVITLALNAFVLWNVDSVDRPKPIQETDATVAVLIPTVDEPFNVVLPALTAAARMRLATRVIVLDDGNRGWLAGMCDELGVEYRPRLRHLDGRSGQLNAALVDLDTDFVVVLEPDQVATRDFIGHALPHFDDRAIALVQTPRDTFSMDSFEHTSVGRRRLSDTALRDRLMAAGRNRWNAAFWSGGAVVLRASALREVGGVASGEASASLRTSVRLHAAGWKSVQHNEVLARGIAAADAGHYAHQTRVDGAAAVQTLRSESFMLGRGLSMAQRISYLQALAAPFSAWRRLGYFVLPAFALLLALTPATGPVGMFAVLLVASYALRGIAYSALKRDRAPHYFVDSLAVIRFTALLGSARTLVMGERPGRSVAPDPDSARRVPVVLWLLGALNLAGLAWAGLAGIGIVDAAYPFAVVAFGAAIWTVVNLVLLASAVARVRSAVFGGDRREAERVEVEGHVYVDGQRVHVLDLSLTGIRALTYDQAPEIGEYCAVTFTDQNRRPAVVTGTVVGTSTRPHGTELRVGLEPDQTFVIGAILADAFIRRD